MTRPWADHARGEPVNDRARIANPAAQAGIGPSDFVVVFHRLETRLSECELTELRRWIRSWWTVGRQRYVVMGCCADTACEDRARRLQGLVDQLVKCGVTREAIRYTDDWVAPPCQCAETALPGDVVWLKAVDAANAGRTLPAISGLLTVDRGPRGERK